MIESVVLISFYSHSHQCRACLTRDAAHKLNLTRIPMIVSHVERRLNQLRKMRDDSGYIFRMICLCMLNGRGATFDSPLFRLNSKCQIDRFHRHIARKNIN